MAWKITGPGSSADRAGAGAPTRQAGLSEQALGIAKELMAARRFLLRGLEAVPAEWHLLAAAIHPRALPRHCVGRFVRPPRRDAAAIVAG